MSKGRYAKKKSKKVPVWVIAAAVLAVVALIATAVILLSDRPEKQDPSDLHAIIQTRPYIPGASSEPGESTAPVMPETTAPDETVSRTEPSEDPEETEEPTQETHVEIVPPPTVVIVQRAEAEYEKWLSAAMIVCVSMEYPDFELEGVYAASATALEDKFSSDGAYILFSAGGERIAIHSKALEGERTEPGTMDISTEVIGFATFDRVDPASVDLKSMEELALDDLSELIAQSLLISIYSR